jgi:hypothetical protein
MSTSTYLAVVNTGNCGQKLVHSSAQPYAVVVCEGQTGRVQEVISRHTTHRGACTACARRNRAAATPASFWSYQASSPTPTVADLPAGAFNGTDEQFSQLSPGMRREILRASTRRA